MTDNRIELRKIAEAAIAVTSLAHEVGFAEGWDLSSLPSELFEHVAAFDPPTVLALLDAADERDALRDERNHWIGEAKRYERLYRRRDADATKWWQQRNDARAALAAALEATS